MAEKESEMDSTDAKPLELEEPRAIELEEPQAIEPIEPHLEDPIVSPRPMPPQKKSGWLGLALGGVIAAGAGYGVAQYVPKGWPIQDTSQLQAALDAQKQQIDLLQEQLASLAAKPKQDDVSERLDVIETAQSDAAAQIKYLQSRPASAGSDPALAEEIAALKEQFMTMQSTVAPDTAAAEALLKEAQAAADKIRAEAEASAARAEKRAALGRVQAALDSGAAFGSALSVLEEVPAVLRESADSGVPTLSSLRDAFPAAARAALDAGIRDDMGDGWTERTLNFLRTQTGARSLVPSEGDGLDAVLSRAEAALAQNDLTAALAELDSLPAISQAALVDWRALADKRQAAIKAAADLAATMEEQR